MNFELKQYLTKKNIVGLIALLVILAAIPLGLYLNSKKQDVRSKATGSDYISVVGPEANVKGTTITGNEVQLQITLPAGVSSDEEGAPQPDIAQTDRYCEVAVNTEDKIHAVYTFKVDYYKNKQKIERENYSIAFWPLGEDKTPATCNDSLTKTDTKFHYINADEFTDGKIKYVYANAESISRGQKNPVFKVFDKQDSRIKSCQLKGDEVKVGQECNDAIGKRTVGCPCGVPGSGPSDQEASACTSGTIVKSAAKACAGELICNKQKWVCVEPEPEED